MVFRVVGRVVAPFVLVVAAATASWAAPGEPVLVKDAPRVVEDVPASHGGWFGWEQHPEGTSEPGDFFVQRGSAARVKVNAARTQGLGGGIVGRSVYYVQKFRDRDPRINRFDLLTGHRSPLPAKVNHHHRGGLWHGVRGQVSVSGAWLLYGGFIEATSEWDYPTWTVMLYNRVDHSLRTLASAEADSTNYVAGQVNGRYATYWSYERYGGSDLYRHDIRTRRSVELPQRPERGDPYDPAVSSDGSVYYFQAVEDGPSDGPRATELVRQPIGAPAEVVTTLTNEPGDGPSGTFVKDRADGSRVVLFSWKGGVYKFVDGPSAGPGA